MTAAAWLNASLRSRIAAEHRAFGVEVVRQRAIAAISGGAIGAIGPVIAVGRGALGRNGIGHRRRPGRRGVRKFTSEHEVSPRPGTSHAGGADDPESFAGASVGLTTSTFTCAVTSRCSRTGTEYRRARRIGSGSWILRLSTSKPEAARRLGDVGRRDRPVERVLLADAAGDDAFRPAARDAIASATLRSCASRSAARFFSALDLTLVAGRDRQRELARQQVVAGEPVGHLHHVAAAAEVVDRFSSE